MTRASRRLRPILAVSLVAASALAAAAASTATPAGDRTDLLERSETWPQRAATRIPLTGRMHGNTVKPGTEGVFLRVEKGHCLIDFGHNGIFSLGVDDTDALERATAQATTRKWSDRGLFTLRYTKSFVFPEDLKPIPLGEFDHYDYFLVLVLDYYGDAAATAKVLETVRASEAADEGEPGLRTLLLPTNEITGEFIEDYRTSAVAMPFVVPFLQEATLHTLHFDFTDSGGAVLIDKNGKILERFAVDSVSRKETFLKSLHRRIEDDRKRRDGR